ncbi:MAG: Pyruvate kinase [Gammaproteobacteria bacterium]|nr:MAG: Pyruvate kinase [Gammaproteobacteria bacterium]
MTKLFITLGPSTLNKKFLNSINSKYVKLLRINLSHTKIKDLKKIVLFIRKYSNIDICFDTEGAQVRTSKVINDKKQLTRNQIVHINKSNISNSHITLTPNNIYKKLKLGDTLDIDFNSAKIKVIDENSSRYKCKVIESGSIGSNKSVSVSRSINIPPFTDKDIKAFELANNLNIKNIALSFTSSEQDIKKLRKYFENDITITSKIESKKGLLNLNKILNEANNILIDRGDLSKEIPLPLIPKKQKEIISAANQRNVPVFVATNLLESMVTKKEPTRAEVNDIYNTLVDGADGLVLAAETAIGNYPTECIDMIIKVSKTLK